ncbi:TIGR03557 family F420-dependent LLM class oxidoreductase [Siccirubricoccus sp. KC 17139]|uniref:TIGR03557 family F420-dependent LLM class oxidoreductase n=1 Tax=Siccirubricoccus soli TaxID=2899147 RepID=A0ABT1D2R7_9PROT|nr:TIGR03557 family F420-dependent LLM class oxidoreductase [Siccirubricoccus soli]MCO6416228.1 TIGR03557 family F420-dependent LLM class oxidoreductase [Siccirubricoccus soli]MCP2682362.1 TIGR03557 family F420-dependent LLM class oxidoreductase [Siccirubricoccus soli]
MVKLGYKLMAEEHGPADLVRNLQRAEAAGFDLAAISDHISPWVEEQGHSSFAWTVLGAMAQATQRIGLMTAVTCPLFRYHPAIIAQAAATVALLSGDRFTLGLGAGERLNEHVIGTGWPGVLERHARLSEALDILGGLLGGEMTHYEGKYYRLDHAKLYDRPAHPVPLVLAAGGPDAARLAAKKSHGLIATEPRKELVEAYRQAGGSGPCYAEVSLCVAESEAAGQEVAHRYARWSLTGWPVMAELPHTESFAAATEHVTPEMVGQQASCGPKAEAHLKSINRFIEAGFDHIILSQIGPDQERFIALFERELAPALRR